MPKKILYIILLVVVVGAIAWQVWFTHPIQNPLPVICTQDAQQCPDGSYVARRAPDCSFAPCPPSIVRHTDTSSWKTAKDPLSGFSFRYPETLPYTYIHMVQWPPMVGYIADAHFSCNQGGSAISEDGEIKQYIINGKQYCVTTKSEGAAGSIYYAYQYKFPFLGAVGLVELTVREVQCMNYDKPEQTACLNEQRNFHINDITLPIIESLFLLN